MGRWKPKPDSGHLSFARLLLWNIIEPVYAHFLQCFAPEEGCGRSPSPKSDQKIQKGIPKSRKRPLPFVSLYDLDIFRSI